MLKSKIQKALSSTAEFVEDHKVALAVVGTTVTFVTLARFVRSSALEAHIEFLKEKNLLNEFNAQFEDPIN